MQRASLSLQSLFFFYFFRKTAVVIGDCTVAVAEASFAGIAWRHGDVTASGEPRRALRDAGEGRRSSWRHNDVIGVDLWEQAGGGWRQSWWCWAVHLFIVHFRRPRVVNSRLFNRLYRYAVSNKL